MARKARMRARVDKADGCVRRTRKLGREKTKKRNGQIGQLNPERKRKECEIGIDAEAAECAFDQRAATPLCLIDI